MLDKSFMPKAMHHMRHIQSQLKRRFHQLYNYVACNDLRE